MVSFYENKLAREKKLLLIYSAIYISFSICWFLFFDKLLNLLFFSETIQTSYSKLSVWLYLFINAVIIGFYVFNHIKKHNSNISQLKIREEFNRFLFNMSPSGMMLMDNMGNVIDANEEYCKLIDYPLADLIKTNIREITHQSVKENITVNLESVMDGNILDHTVPIVKKDGNLRYIRLQERRIKLLNGQPGILVAATDVTDKKIMIEKLKESENLLEAFFTQSLDGFYIMLLDKPVYWNKSEDSTETFRYIMENERIVKVNNALLQQYKIKKEDFIGSSHVDMFENIVEIGQQYWKQLYEEGRTHIVMSISNSEKSEIWVEGDYIALYDENGRIRGHFGIQRDITEKINSEKELIDAKIRAEKSDELKSEFLAQMSHEIRTPINTILSYSSMIRAELEQAVPDDLRYGFESIDKAGRRITRTIDLLINMSEVQVGSYQIKKDRLDLLNDILPRVYSDFNVDAKEKGLEFKITKKCTSAEVYCDFHSVEQILSNLVDNAIKYTSDGKVSIIVSQSSDRKVVVEVTDTGIGISEEFQEDIFNIFTQEDRGYTRKYEGNGLGLALVKSYCDMNDIFISIESEKGKGTTFRLIFLQ